METTSKHIIYEHPLNERTRTLLRFEHLFKQTDFHSNQTEIWDSRAAVNALVDTMNILLSRTDLKGELLKELVRYKSYMNGIRKNPNLDATLLAGVLEDLDNSIGLLQGNSGQFGQNLRESEFLQSILQRSSLPGGNCAFDLPLYHYWLEKPHQERISNLQEWKQSLESVQISVTLLLSLMRKSTVPTREYAVNGLFQQDMDTQSPARLVRIILPSDTIFFPKVSGSRHRFTIRFQEATDLNNTVQTKRDVDFYLTCCTI